MRGTGERNCGQFTINGSDVGKVPAVDVTIRNRPSGITS